MKPQILVIDDDEVIRWVIERNLLGHPYQVVTCGSSQEALSRIQEEAPDLILSDYNLSSTEKGIALARTIQEQMQQAIPVIIMSGSADCQQEAEYHDFHYIRKPFEFLHLIALIRSCLAESSRPLCEHGLVAYSGLVWPFPN